MYGMVTGAAKAPTVAPALKILVANARSFLGKYSAVALMAAGKFPASPRASTKRAKMNSERLVDKIKVVLPTVESACFAPAKLMAQVPVIMPEVAIPQKAWIHAPTDQIPMAQRKPFLVSIQSTKRPATNIDPA
ncbi:hypothetical protein D3C73_1322680 [compost metagenome]